jgi:DNA-directed RNA polymerase subunit RPC12/RpoP
MQRFYIVCPKCEQPSAVSTWKRGHDEPRIKETLFYVCPSCGKDFGNAEGHPDFKKVDEQWNRIQEKKMALKHRPLTSLKKEDL